MDSKRYYWLKLKRDFFKRHDIRIIEEMPNGKDYILFYLKLLCESVDHEGKLRFSESIPYSDDMLSTITNTNIDIVRSAVKAFTSLEMMEIQDDGTIFMSEVEKMIGSAVDNDNANRQRRFRENQKAKALPDSYEDITQALPDRYEGVTDALQNVTEALRNITDDVTKDNESKSKSKRKSIEIDKEIDKELENKGVTQPAVADTPKRFIKPSLEEVKEYCRSRGNKVDPERFYSYYEANGWYVGKRKMRDWKAGVRYWETDEEKAKSFNRKGSYFTPTGNEDAYTKANQNVTGIDEDDAGEDELLALGIGTNIGGK